MSFRRILVSTYPSELSNKAIHAAIELVQESGALLVAVTVVEPDPYAGMAGRQSEASDSHSARQRVHAEACLYELRRSQTQAVLANSRRPVLVYR